MDFFTPYKVGEFVLFLAVLIAVVSPPAFPPLRHPAGYTHRSGKRRQERARERLHEGKTHHACTYLPTYCYRRRPTSLLPTQVECVRVQCNPPPSFQLPPLFFHPCLLGFLLQYFQCVTAPKCIRVEKGGREKNCLLCKTEKRRRSCPLSTLFFCYIFRIIERGGCAF